MPDLTQIQGELTVTQPKTKASTRTVVLPEPVLDILKGYLAIVLERVGCKHVRFHDLRHSYAVAAIKSGDDIKTVQENLGHATAAFTLDVYGQVTAQMRRESASRMEQFIQSVSAG